MLIQTRLGKYQQTIKIVLVISSYDLSSYVKKNSGYDFSRLCLA
jgi:hypothetical protein